MEKSLKINQKQATLHNVNYGTSKQLTENQAIALREKFINLCLIDKYRALKFAEKLQEQGRGKIIPKFLFYENFDEKLCKFEFFGAKFTLRIKHKYDGKGLYISALTNKIATIHL